jgi:hypothetical protein
MAPGLTELPKGPEPFALVEAAVEQRCHLEARGGGFGAAHLVDLETAVRGSRPDVRAGASLHRVEAAVVR